MSSDMEYMDIDGPEFLSTINDEIATIRTNGRTDTSSADIFDSYVGEKVALKEYNEMCVLDTNFLISKLGYLDTVLSIAEENPGSILIILPWVVIRELDGLKSVRPGKDTKDIAVRARQAMRFIELRLREKSNSLRGQKMNETLDQSMTQKQVKGDDRILDCCMYFQHMTGKKVTLLSNDRNLCIKVMVHDIESVSTESVPKMEALLNRIGGKQKKIATKKWTVPQQPEPVINTDDYVMEIDEFYPSHNNSNNSNNNSNTMDEEDYDMMIDDDEGETELSKLTKGTSESRWAKYESTIHKPIPEPVAYLDNDPTLVAPRKPPQNLTYSNSNYVPIKNDASWTSIYSPR